MSQGSEPVVGLLGKTPILDAIGDSELLFVLCKTQ